MSDENKLNIKTIIYDSKRYLSFEIRILECIVNKEELVVYLDEENGICFEPMSGFNFFKGKPIGELQILYISEYCCWSDVDSLGDDVIIDEIKDELYHKANIEFHSSAIEDALRVSIRTSMERVL